MPDLLVLLGRVVLHAGLALSLVAIASFPGRLLIERLGFASRLERWVLGAVVGLGVVGTALGICAVLGLFGRVAVLAVAAVCLGAGIACWRRRDDGPESPERREAGAGGGRFLCVWAAVGVLFVLSLWTLAAYPPSAFDDTMYHLPYVESLLESGRFEFLAERRFPLFPQLNETLFGTVMLWGGDVTPQYVQTLVVLLLVALAFVWARRSQPLPVAGAVAAMVAGTPVLLWVGTTAYVDATVSLFVIAGLYARQRWIEGLAADGEGASRWLLLAGALLGFAAGTKYHGLFFLGVVGAAEAIRCLRRGLWRPPLGFAATALAGGGIWYLRNFAVTGNPFFPFVTTVFGGNPWSMEGMLGRRRGWTWVEPAWDGWTELLSQAGLVLLKLPEGWWLLLKESIAPTRVPPFATLWVLVLPIAIVWGLYRRDSRFLAAIVVLYAVFCVGTAPSPRHLIHVTAPVALLAAPALAAAGRALGRLTADGGVVAMVLLPGLLIGPAFGYSALRFADFGVPAVTEEQRFAFLARRYEAYPTVQCLNANLGDGYTLYGLTAPYMPYYTQGRFLGEAAGPHRYARLARVVDSPSLMAAELESMGADFLMTARRLDRRVLDPAAPPPPFELVMVCQGTRLFSIGPRPDLGRLRACPCPDDRPTSR